MFTIANQSIINIRSDTDLQNAKNERKFEFRGHGLRITLNSHDDLKPTKISWFMAVVSPRSRNN